MLVNSSDRTIEPAAPSPRVSDARRFALRQPEGAAFPDVGRGDGPGPAVDVPACGAVVPGAVVDVDVGGAVRGDVAPLVVGDAAVLAAAHAASVAKVASDAAPTSGRRIMSSFSVPGRAARTGVEGIRSRLPDRAGFASWADCGENEFPRDEQPAG